MIDQTIGVISAGKYQKKDKGKTKEKSMAGRVASRKVFVVHGHDEVARETTARFLEKSGLEAIILHEQPNAGQTIIEKFEKHGDVAFAVVLLTPDDVGAPRDKDKDLKPRARQNVVLELGYFMGRLGRTHVAALVKGEIESPSDYDGVLYVPMDIGGAWKLQLARELKTAGLDVDLNKAVQSGAGWSTAAGTDLSLCPVLVPPSSHNRRHTSGMSCRITTDAPVAQLDRVAASERGA